ncbi:hypothetical protein PspLS_05904 [Pyricularia sp. CBS 133598]|nr:hypothetical protein PspLS_05904 [Pyricularia sp. CBS 133598]
MSTGAFKPINASTAQAKRDKPPFPESPSSNGLNTPTNSEVDDFASAVSTKSSSFDSSVKSPTTPIIESGSHQLQGVTLTELSLADVPPSAGQESPANGVRNRDFGPIGPRTKFPSTPQSTRTRRDDNFGYNPFASHPDLAGRRDAVDFGMRGAGSGSSQQSPGFLAALRQPQTPARNSPWSQRPLFSSSTGLGSRGPAVFSPASNHGSSADTTFVDSPPSPLALREERYLRTRVVQPSPVQQAEPRGYAGSLFPIRADPLRNDNNNNNNTTTTNETFRPMHTVQVKHHNRSPRHAQQSSNKAIHNIMNGFSPNYQGDTSLANNRSANIPESESCSLFILGLPPTLTTTQLLGAIRNTGRVWASHINLPEPSRGHTTCAAKVIFFERAAAQRFYAAHQPQNGGFVTDPFSGLPPARVLWNRIRSAEVGPSSATGGGGGGGGPGSGGNKSRVLLIYGPRRLVNEPSLTAYFASKMEFQIDRAFELASCVDPATGQVMVLFEYRFGSFRCQAEAAKMSLSREFKDEIKVWYGDDPCAPGGVDPEVAPRSPVVNLWPGSPQALQPRRFDGSNYHL